MRSTCWIVWLTMGFCSWISRKNDPAISSDKLWIEHLFSLCLVEKVGFEPTAPISGSARFPSESLQPLGHLSVNMRLPKRKVHSTTNDH